VPRRVAWVALVVLGLFAPTARADDARYALANGCYSLKAGDVVAGPFRMKATDLGSYMLYGAKGDYLARTGDGVGSASGPGPDADWKVDGTTGAFTVSLPAAGKALGTSGGKLALVDPSAAAKVDFQNADGCAIYPESEVDVTGAPSTSENPWGEVKGLLDAHMHWMAFEFLGGRAHCGKPWDRYGITKALVDCPDHEPGGAGAVLENVLNGGTTPTHDTVGWPTFGYWPNYHSLTHEDSYYKWVERAWRGGLRIFVNLFVDNGALCTVYPYKSHNCNEMDTVRLEIAKLNELQDYVDAQNGGPGKGWLRIVSDPFQARKVISEGKLAVVPGIEVSRLFDCQLLNDVPQCDKAKIERNLDAVYKAGVRDMELVNKFDNAFVGVAGDDGSTGVVVNQGNKIETGKYWDMQTCQGVPADVHDHDQVTAPGIVRDGLVGGIFSQFIPHGEAPVYPAPPHCNAKGLSSLGEYLLTRMMNKGMIIDPDHMSVLARNQTLALLEARRYSGVISSHSWSTPDAYPRIYKLGGVITPYAGDSTGFVKEWRTLRTERDPRFYFGFGWGADMNGFGAQGPPRPDAASNPVVYPFKSFDGQQTIDRVRTGKRVWDINKDGVAHYGLYPDWVEDLRKIAGDEIVNDMGRGAEAYLEMWERATGVPMSRCQPARTRFAAGGLGRVVLNTSNEALLRSAGQPAVRGARVWRWCVQQREGRKGRIFAVLTPQGAAGLVASTYPQHVARKIGAGDRLSHGTRLVVRSAGGARRFVYGVRAGRVRWVAVATGTVARDRSRLRGYLKLAGLR
jgi:hypothetical protein